MSRYSRLRILVAVAFAFGALTIVSGPVSAETQLSGCLKNRTSLAQGTCGYWEVYDASVGKKGAVCVYGGNAYKLVEITVRPPLMHGFYSKKTKVGWRFKVQRMSNGGGAWSTIYTSPLQTAMANDAVPAYVGQGFSRRAWNASNDPSGYRYRIELELQWWAPNNGPVEGYKLLKYDWYKSQKPGSSRTDADYCLQSY